MFVCYNFLMRILLIGKSVAARAFAQYFTQNPDNIVFCTLDDTEAEFIDILPDNAQELCEFAQANEMTLTLICDENLMQSNIVSVFTDTGLSVFAPCGSALKILNSKIQTKKFIYKNKIPTPRFQFFEKPQAALDYIRKNPLPVFIKPDTPNASKACVATTFSRAKEAVENIFNCGAKKILTEEYLWGKEFCVYTICDGSKALALGEIAKFQNSFAALGADFLDEKDREQVSKSINTIFEAISKEYGGYLGILGFNFIKANDKIYLLGFETFFKDIDVQIMLQSLGQNWDKLFISALSGRLNEDFPQLEQSQDYALACEFYENGKKINISSSAKTFNAARRMLIDDGADAKEIEEALRFWKY